MALGVTDLGPLYTGSRFSRVTFTAVTPSLMTTKWIAAAVSDILHLKKVQKPNFLTFLIVFFLWILFLPTWILVKHSAYVLFLFEVVYLFFNALVHVQCFDATPYTLFCRGPRSYLSTGSAYHVTTNNTKPVNSINTSVNHPKNTISQSEVTQAAESVTMSQEVTISNIGGPLWHSLPI